MPNSTVSLRYFELKIGLKATLEMRAGTTPKEATDGKYKTRAKASRAIFGAILQKLATAIDDQAKAIDVTVKDDKWIVLDSES